MGKGEPQKHIVQKCPNDAEHICCLKKLKNMKKTQQQNGPQNIIKFNNKKTLVNFICNQSPCFSETPRNFY